MSTEQLTNSTEVVNLSDLALGDSFASQCDDGEPPKDSLYRLPPEIRAEIGMWAAILDVGSSSPSLSHLRILRLLNREFYFMSTPRFFEDVRLEEDEPSPSCLKFKRFLRIARRHGHFVRRFSAVLDTRTTTPADILERRGHFASLILPLLPDLNHLSLGGIPCSQTDGPATFRCILTELVLYPPKHLRSLQIGHHQAAPPQRLADVIKVLPHLTKLSLHNIAFHSDPSLGAAIASLHELTELGLFLVDGTICLRLAESIQLQEWAPPIVKLSILECAATIYEHLQALTSELSATLQQLDYTDSRGDSLAARSAFSLPHLHDLRLRSAHYPGLLSGFSDSPLRRLHLLLRHQANAMREAIDLAWSVRSTLEEVQLQVNDARTREVMLRVKPRFEAEGIQFKVSGVVID